MFLSHPVLHVALKITESQLCLVLSLCVCVLCAVAGLGFGIMSGAFSMINILSDSLGPGTVGIFGDSQYYFITAGELLQSLMGHRDRQSNQQFPTTLTFRCGVFMSTYDKAFDRWHKTSPTAGERCMFY